jgi:hypothetical protein
MEAANDVPASMHNTASAATAATMDRFIIFLLTLKPTFDGIHPRNAHGRMAIEHRVLF